MRTNRRKCSECGQVLSVSAFPETSEGLPGSMCLKCWEAYKAEFHERRPGSFVREREGDFIRKRRDKR